MAKILCVEDDPDIQRLFGSALFREGYDVHYAFNGKEGYEKILQLDPDLVLLDLMLPIMNGVELLKKLQEDKLTRNIPTIVVTAYGDEADMLKYAMDVLGAKCYLRKPVQLNELVGNVKRILTQFPRASRQPAETKLRELRKGCILMDPKFLTVWIDDHLIATLPRREFAALRILMENPGPITKTHLLKALGYKTVQGDALKQIICRLRTAFGPFESRRIKTTPKGYELIG